jgi:hypothetical protein
MRGTRIVAARTAQKAARTMCLFLHGARRDDASHRAYRADDRAGARR